MGDDDADDDGDGTTGYDNDENGSGRRQQWRNDDGDDDNGDGVTGDGI